MKRGFTLLEVLVATTLMAIAVAGVLAALSTSMRNGARLTEYDRAALLARRKMDELLVDKRLPRFAVLEGQWDESKGWRARIQPWELPQNPGPGAAVLDRVELEIWWQEGGRRRTFTLDGFRRGILTPADVAAAAAAAQVPR